MSIYAKMMCIPALIVKYYYVHALNTLAKDGKI